MKTLLFVFGTSGAMLMVAGSFFKIMHWAGANMMLILGLGCFVFLFIPAFAVHLYRKPK